MATRAKEAVEFFIEDIGWGTSDTFDGRGVANSNWDAVFVGAGASREEAYNDALENAAQADWDTNEVPEDPRNWFGEEPGQVLDEPEAPMHDGFGSYNYYVALYVRGPKWVWGEEEAATRYEIEAEISQHCSNVLDDIFTDVGTISDIDDNYMGTVYSVEEDQLYYIELVTKLIPWDKRQMDEVRKRRARALQEHNADPVRNLG